MKLEAPDLLGSRFGFSAEHFQIDYNSTGGELKSMTADAAAFFRDVDPNLDTRLGNYTTSMNGPDDQQDEITIVRGDWTTSIRGWDVNLFASHSLLRSRLTVDFDSLPVSLISVPSRDDNPQTTVELRAVAPPVQGFLGLPSLLGASLGSTDFTGSLFYQNRQLVDDRTTIEIDTTRLVAASVANDLDPSPDTGSAAPPLGIGAGDVPSLIESSTMFFGQNANTFAAFGNLEWHFLPRWTLVAGLRFNVENKKAVWKRVFTTPTHVVFTQSLNWREFEMRDERTDFDFVPKVAVGWKPIDGVRLFASWTKGVKGGGFNDTASGPSELERTFDRERVEQWEIDSRWNLLDGKLAAGLTLFRMELRDFQLITTRPQDVVHNDAHFIEFPFGACALSFPDTDGDGDARCDYAGVPFAPNWIITFTPAVSLPLEDLPLVRGLRWVR